MGNSTATPTTPAFLAQETQSIPPIDPPTPGTTPKTPANTGGNNKAPKILMAVGVLVLLVATGVGVMLTRTSQVTQTQAADCARYNFTVSAEGVVTVINGSTATVPPNTATVSVNNAQVGSFNIPSLAPGQSSQLGNVDVPTNGAFTWEVTSPTTSCSDGGNYLQTDTTALPSPSASSLAQCTAITAYSQTWTPLTATQLSALTPGSKVRFVVSANGQVDMAQFTINGVAGPEVTTQQPGTENFYYEYTIPANTMTFRVTAQVHDEATDAWY